MLRHRSRWRPALAVVVAVTASCPVWIAAEPAAAACAGPSITVEPGEGPPGGMVTISGSGFWRDCIDTGSVLSPMTCNKPWLASPPLRDIDLVLVGPDRERVLATVDGPRFELEVAIPPDTPPGEATVEARIGSTRQTYWPAAFVITDSEPVSPPPPPPAPRPSLPAPGYLLAAGDGGVFTFGARQFHGSASHLDLNAPIVSIASVPEGGYWLAAGDGGIFAFGAAEFINPAKDFGCGPSVVGPVTAIAQRPSDNDDGRIGRRGYWTTTRGGFVLRFNAGYHGAVFALRLESDPGPVVALASHPAGYGYWQATAGGGVFAFGEAPFAGSLAGVSLRAPIVAMASTPTGNGYWLAAADGGVFAFGDAAFRGSLAGRPLNAPVVGIATAPDGEGYWLVAADGGVFAFGSAPFLGSLAGVDLNGPIVGIAS